MNPDEAREKLIAMLDTQAEHFRRVPRIYYVATNVYRGTKHEQYVRLFVVMPDGELECIDYLVRRAVRAETGTRNSQKDGQYTPERGFRMDAISGQPTQADIYDLLTEVFEGSDVNVRAIEIVEKY